MLTLSPADLDRLSDIRYEQAHRHEDAYATVLPRDAYTLRDDIDFLVRLLDQALIDFDDDITLVIGSAAWRRANGLPL